MDMSVGKSQNATGAQGATNVNLNGTTQIGNTTVTGTATALAQASGGATVIQPVEYRHNRCGFKFDPGHQLQRPVPLVCRPRPRSMKIRRPMDQSTLPTILQAERPRHLVSGIPVSLTRNCRRLPIIVFHSVPAVERRIAPNTALSAPIKPGKNLKLITPINRPISRATIIRIKYFWFVRGCQ